MTFVNNKFVIIENSVNKVKVLDGSNILTMTEGATLSWDSELPLPKEPRRLLYPGFASEILILTSETMEVLDMGTLNNPNNIGSFGSGGCSRYDLQPFK